MKSGTKVNTCLGLENSSYVRPHFLKVLLSILWEKGGKGAFFSERIGHVSFTELLYVPVIYAVIVPG